MREQPIDNAKYTRDILNRIDAKINRAMELTGYSEVKSFLERNKKYKKYKGHEEKIDGDQIVDLSNMEVEIDLFIEEENKKQMPKNEERRMKFEKEMSEVEKKIAEWKQVARSAFVKDFINGQEDFMKTIKDRVKKAKYTTNKEWLTEMYILKSITEQVQLYINTESSRELENSIKTIEEAEKEIEELKQLGLTDNVTKELEARIKKIDKEGDKQQQASANNKVKIVAGVKKYIELFKKDVKDARYHLNDSYMKKDWRSKIKEAKILIKYVMGEITNIEEEIEEKIPIRRKNSMEAIIAAKKEIKALDELGLTDEAITALWQRINNIINKGGEWADDAKTEMAKFNPAKSDICSLRFNANEAERALNANCYRLSNTLAEEAKKNLFNIDDAKMAIQGIDGRIAKMEKEIEAKERSHDVGEKLYDMPLTKQNEGATTTEAPSRSYAAAFLTLMQSIFSTIMNALSAMFEEALREREEDYKNSGRFEF